MTTFLESARRRFASLAALVAIGVLPAQETRPAEPATRVDVPTFGNPTCPIMGKKVSMPLFVDTDLGRFYLCCKPCRKKVLADVATAHKTAYPVVKEWTNERCPVSGEAIGKDTVELTLQGHRFALCCSGCTNAARAHSQVTLTKLTAEGAIDVGNTTCPISGKPTTANAFVRIGDHLVHLASPTLVEEVAKAPGATLAKAQEIAKAQPPKPKHVHAPASEPAHEPVPGSKE